MTAVCKLNMTNRFPRITSQPPAMKDRAVEEERERSTSTSAFEVREEAETDDKQGGHCLNLRPTDGNERLNAVPC